MYVHVTRCSLALLIAVAAFDDCRAAQPKSEKIMRVVAAAGGGWGIMIMSSCEGLDLFLSSCKLLWKVRAPSSR